MKLGWKYFRECTTEGDYTNHLNMLMWCIDAAQRFTTKKKGFFVMLNQYIDLDNPNGLGATFRWWDTHKQNEADKQKKRRRRQEIDTLRQWVLYVFHHPDRVSYERARSYIHRHLPRYEWRFERSVAHIINRPATPPPDE